MKSYQLSIITLCACCLIAGGLMGFLIAKRVYMPEGKSLPQIEQKTAKTKFVAKIQ